MKRKSWIVACDYPGRHTSYLTALGLCWAWDTDRSRALRFPRRKDAAQVVALRPGSTLRVEVAP